MKKRLFSLLLSLCMVLSLLPFGASAAEVVDTGVCGDRLYWSLDRDGVLTIAGEGEMTDFSSTGSPFYNNTFIRSVVLDSGVTSVGAYAFIGCSNLASVETSESVASIHDFAFFKCTSLSSLKFSEGMEQIGAHAFSGCSGLTSLELPSGVTSIGNSAFSGCTGITSLTIPSSAETIGGGAFSGCTGLTVVALPEGVASIGGAAFSGCTGLRSVTLPVSLKSVGRGAFYNCTGLERVNIADLSAWCGVTFGDAAANPLSQVHALCLNGDQMTDVTIPSDVTSLKAFVFSGLDSITVPMSVTAVAENAYYGVSDIWYPGRLEQWNAICRDHCGDIYVGMDATLHTSDFTGSCGRCGDNVYWRLDPDGNLTVSGTGPIKDFYTIDERSGDRTLTSPFRNVSDVRSAVIESGVTSVGGCMFYQCAGLESVTISEGVTSIGRSAFYACTALRDLTLPQGLTYLNEYAFSGCSSLTSVVLPDSVTKMDRYAFYRCEALQHAKICGDIGSGAFMECPALESVEMTGGTLLDTGALRDCPALTTVYLPVTLTTISKRVFLNDEALRDVYYAGTKAQWQAITRESSGNTALTNATKHYADSPATELAITTQPKAVTVSEGAKATFTVKATGTGLTYQWQYSTDGASWTNSTASCANSPTFTITPKGTYSGRLYRCVVTDASGKSVASNAAKLTVQVKGPSITAQPKATTVYEGEVAEFTVKATGTGLTYQWQYSSDGGATWKNSTAVNAQNPTLLTTVKASFNGRLYRCRVTDQYGKGVTSNPAKLTVKSDTLAITAQPKDVTVAPGQKASFTVMAAGTGLKFQWQYSTNGGKTWNDSTALCANYTTFTITPKNSYRGRLYRCVVTDASGRSVTSSAAKLTVDTALRIAVQPKSITAAKDSTVKFKITAQGVGLTYQWQLKVPGGAWRDTTAKSGKTATLSVVATAGKNAYQYRCIVTDASGNQVISEPAVLAVY